MTLEEQGIDNLRGEVGAPRIVEHGPRGRDEEWVKDPVSPRHISANGGQRARSEALRELRVDQLVWSDPGSWKVEGQDHLQGRSKYRRNRDERQWTRHPASGDRRPSPPDQKPGPLRPVDCRSRQSAWVALGNEGTAPHDQRPRHQQHGRHDAERLAAAGTCMAELPGHLRDSRRTTRVPGRDGSWEQAREPDCVAEEPGRGEAGPRDRYRHEEQRGVVRPSDWRRDDAGGDEGRKDTPIAVLLPGQPDR